MIRWFSLLAPPLLAAFLLTPAGLAQGEVTLSGTVRDAQTEELLIGANVFVPSRQAGVAADERGEYRLTLPPGTYEVRISYVGYETQRVTVQMDRDRVLPVRLVPSGALEEVTVTADDETDIRAPALGVTRLDLRELARLPSFLGEVDVTRGLLLLPGVTSVGEGSGGFNVRGGNVDQNLVLLDGSQVFFASHLFGLFSTFNPDLVDEVTLYRGSIPARYGGRISSVLEVRQRDGRADRFGVRGNVGLVGSRLTLEGPIAGDRLTALVGGRVSYVNWLIRQAERPDLKQSAAGYADLGGLLRFRPSSRFQARLSGYLSADDFRFGADTTYRYDTRNASLRAAYAVSSQVSSTFDAALSTYAYGFESEAPLVGFGYDAEVLHGRLQPAVAWAAPGRTLEGGVAVELFDLSPGRFAPAEGSTLLPIFLERERGVDAGVYLSADVERGRWRGEAGLRYGVWTTLGPATVPIIDPELPRGPAAVVGTETVGSGEVVARYAGLEPRLAVRYAVGEASALKAGYSRLRQNVHLLSNTTAPTPVDRWKLSDTQIRPQVGDQVSAGVAGPVGMGMTVSVEGYYRWLYDLPDYRPGASLLLSEFVAAELLDGDGRAYGAELLVERPAGTVTGRFSYAIARTERRVFSDRPGERVNFGAYYPSDFDRPHDLALTLAFNESAWATWGMNFVYSSGRPITYPTGVYDLGNLVVPSYTLRNQARLPDYHRLDLSLTVDAPREGRYRGRWTVALYNVYSRRNAYSVFFRQEPGTRIPRAYRLSTFGSIFPSVTYTFEF